MSEPDPYSISSVNIPEGDKDNIIYCSICLDIPGGDRGNVITPCNHNFCFKCLITSLQIKLECPICRGNLNFSEIIDDNEEYTHQISFPLELISAVIYGGIIENRHRHIENPKISLNQFIENDHTNESICSFMYSRGGNQRICGSAIHRNNNINILDKRCRKHIRTPGVIKNYLKEENGIVSLK